MSSYLSTLKCNLWFIFYLFPFVYFHPDFFLRGNHDEWLGSIGTPTHQHIKATHKVLFQEVQRSQLTRSMHIHGTYISIQIIHICMKANILGQCIDLFNKNLEVLQSNSNNNQNKKWMLIEQSAWFVSICQFNGKITEKNIRVNNPSKYLPAPK